MEKKVSGQQGHSDREGIELRTGGDETTKCST